MYLLGAIAATIISLGNMRKSDYDGYDPDVEVRMVQLDKACKKG